MANSRTLDMPPYILLPTGHIMAILRPYVNKCIKKENDKAFLLQVLADAEIVMVARESNLYSEKCHWAQVLVPATVYLILATVY